ncbi:MAG: hypothetical protein C0484_07215 [Rhodospirillum sp.]|nr:hypothetical protein [Rhodospirillum sp.]
MRDCRCRSRCLWPATAASPSALPPSSSRCPRKKAGGFGGWPPASVVNEGQQRLLRQFVPAFLAACGARGNPRDQTFYLALFIFHSSSDFAFASHHDLPVTTSACRVCWRHLDCEHQALLICRIPSADNNAKPNSMIDGSPLVSVVVPAFNAAKTISDTLRSISRQTYTALEIVVVDDGSTDETADLARRYGATDSRVRVVTKPNGGVASARNAGIRCTAGAFVAFIDADDLWHPTKIAKQLKVLLAGGPDMALVYAPFRLIDADSRVLASPHKYGVNGWVIHRHFYSNLVGNGSALLVHRSVLEEFGGFDSWLLQQGAEGCEDLLLQLRIAARYRFGEVSEYLVGYRRLPDNMSSNKDQMIRSGILAVNKALSECRHIPSLSADAMLKRYAWHRLRAQVQAGQLRESLWPFVRQVALSPAFAAGALWSEVAALAGKVNRAATTTLLPGRSGTALPHFYELDPLDGIDLHHDTATSRALRRLARFDRAYRPLARPTGPHAISSALDQGLDAFDSRDLTSSCTYQKG